jgi:hypothetical protein
MPGPIRGDERSPSATRQPTCRWDRHLGPRPTGLRPAARCLDPGARGRGSRWAVEAARVDQDEGVAAVEQPAAFGERREPVGQATAIRECSRDFIWQNGEGTVLFEADIAERGRSAAAVSSSRHLGVRAAETEAQPACGRNARSTRRARPSRARCMTRLGTGCRCAACTRPLVHQRDASPEDVLRIAEVIRENDGVTRSLRPQRVLRVLHRRLSADQTVVPECHGAFESGDEPCGR